MVLGGKRYVATHPSVCGPLTSGLPSKVPFDEEFFSSLLGSTNGTLVNGSKEERRYLDDSDELRMGRLILRIEIDREGGKCDASV